MYGSGSSVVVIRPRVGGFIANVDAESNVQRSGVFLTAKGVGKGFGVVSRSHV